MIVLQVAVFLATICFHIIRNGSNLKAHRSLFLLLPGGLLFKLCIDLPDFDLTGSLFPDSNFPDPMFYVVPMKIHFKTQKYSEVSLLIKVDT